MKTNSCLMLMQSFYLQALIFTMQCICVCFAVCDQYHWKKTEAPLIWKKIFGISYRMGRDLGCYSIISAQCHNAQSNIIVYCHKIIKAHIVTPLLASSWLKVRAFNIFQLCVDHKYDADVFPTGLSSLESNIVSWRIRFENLPTGPIQSEGEKTEEQNKM